MTTSTTAITVTGRAAAMTTATAAVTATDPLDRPGLLAGAESVEVPRNGIDDAVGRR
jgi:hypothetical protein